MKHAPKGQVFSLDLLIALAMFVLLIGFSLKIMETSRVQSQETQLQSELKQVADTAALLLVTSPQSVCTLTNIAGDSLAHMTGCVDSDKLILLSKSDLGVPSRFEFDIWIDGSMVHASGLPGTTPAIYVVDVPVLLHAGNLPKSEWQTCMAGGSCSGELKTIQVRAWRT